MAIELDLVIRGHISAKNVVDGTKDMLRKLAQCDPPDIVFERMTNGERKCIGDDELGGQDGLYIMSFAGRDEGVSVTVLKLGELDQTSICVGADITRSASEYILGLAVAIYIAERYDACINDGFQFWTGSDTHRPSELRETIMLDLEASSFDQACELLLDGRAR